MIHLDSTLLIDRLRESARDEAGRATRFLEDASKEEIVVSVHAFCELYAGAALSDNPEKERERIETVWSAVHIAYPDEKFAPAFGRLLAWQQQRGQRIGTMDLLIATAAVLDNAPLVTRNRRDFSRVPNLELIEY